MRFSQNVTQVYFPRVTLLASLTSQLTPSSHQDSAKACADPAVSAYRMQEKQAEHITSQEAAPAQGHFFLYSEPIRNFSHTSALWEDELNKSLLGRVTFRLQCQSFWKWCGAKSVVRASDIILFSCVGLWTKNDLLLSLWLFLILFPCYWKASYRSPLSAI